MQEYSYSQTERSSIGFKSCYMFALEAKEYVQLGGYRKHGGEKLSIYNLDFQRGKNKKTGGMWANTTKEEGR
jgi:hypothetical protein